jgi:very-short-patch-repair endonuclease
MTSLAAFVAPPPSGFAPIRQAPKIAYGALDRVPLVKTHFRRQAPIGPYVVDFVSLRARLVIELDGPSHTEPGAAEKDARRTA